MFTFGPWGFLYRGYHPVTFAAQLAAWMFLAYAVAVALWHVAIRRFDTHGGRLLWTSGVVLLIGASPRESTLLLLPFLLTTTDEDDRGMSSSALSIVLASACALAGLVKLSALVLGVALVGVASARDLSRRRLPVAGAAYCCGLLFFWLLAGRPFREIPQFAISSVQLLVGYTDASSLPTFGSPGLLVASLLIGLVLIALVGGLEWRRKRGSAIFMVGALALTSLSAIKAGFVRADWYHLPTTLVTLAVMVVVTVAVCAPRQKRQRIWVAGSFVAAAGLVMPALGVLAAIVPQFRAVVRVAEVRRVSDERFAAEIAAIRSRTPVPVRGSVDIYPHRQSIVVANDLRYAPRPVFQSYIAWTPALARRNEEHLATAGAAEHLLFEVRPVDGRLSSLEDGLSWPEILSRYRLSSRFDSLLLLEKRQAPRKSSMKAMASRPGGFGERIPVPAHRGMVWTSIDLESTALGKLASLAFRSPVLYITLEFRDGSTRTQRLVPKLASAGFLLSPHVVDSEAFAALMAGDGQLRDFGVVAIRVTGETGNPGIFYRSPFEVTFSALEIGAENEQLSLARKVNPIIGAK